MKIIKWNIFFKTSILIFWLIFFFIFLYAPLLKKEISKNTINVLTWGGLIDSNIVSKFEKEYEIKVNLNYYETNDELFSKLQITNGKEYDLITITDSGLKFLKEKDILKKIDKSKLDFFQDIDNHFFGHSFDPNYDYSLPLFWDIFGLGVNKKFFNNKLPVATWGLIFDKKIAQGRISMTDEALNAILIAAQYLYSKTKNLDDYKLDKIKQLLINQKNIVELYTDLRVDYMLRSGVCSAVASKSAYMYKEIKDNPDLAFLVPQEGGFLVMDLLVIPKFSSKDKLIYKFINYIYKEKNLKKHFKKFGYLPVLIELLKTINLRYLGGLQHLFSKDIFSKLSLFETNVSPSEINQVWTSVKA